MATIETNQENKSRKIQLLPEHLIDQIKAGEVVERPASLIKELIENSIDAGATKIDIHIVDNGMDLIRIDDNGTGMSFEDLPFAFGRHATSKIDKYDDLFNLHSFGFRGEALASISSVARLTCTSTPIENDLQGGKILIHGGKIMSHSEFDNYQHGTSIYIKDLFYNTPVRLKFLKSQTSEKNALNKIINAFIISNNHIEFSVKYDEKEKVIYPKVTDENLSSRIKKLFFKKKDSQDKIIQFEDEYDNYKVKGYISQESTAGYTGKKQYLFANGRYFQDKSLHQCIMRQAEKLWGPGRSGHYVVLVDVPPAKIDVNIHPNKIQIKFQDSSIIYSLLNTSLKKNIIESYKLDQNSSQTPIDFPEQDQEQIDSYFENDFNNIEKPQELNRESNFNNNYYKLSNRFFISSDEKHKYLLDSKKLFLLYWIENIKDNQVLENIISPLLITEPFQIDDHAFDLKFDLYKDLGFEFERIENKLVVLRTIPNYLNGSPYLEVLSQIINASNVESIEGFVEMLHKILDSEHSFDFQFRDIQLNDLKNYFPQEYLIKNNILTVLDDSILNKISGN